MGLAFPSAGAAGLVACCRRWWLWCPGHPGGYLVGSQGTGFCDRHVLNPNGLISAALLRIFRPDLGRGAACITHARPEVLLVDGVAHPLVCGRWCCTCQS